MSTITIRVPGYTQIPNALLDNLATFTESQINVLLIVCRQTFGWHKVRAKLSLSFLSKGTGLSEQSVLTAMQQLMERSLVDRVKSGNSFEYFLVVQPVDHPNQLTDSPQPVDRSDGKSPQPVGTKKETVLKKEKDTSVAVAPEPFAPPSRRVTVPAETLSDDPDVSRGGSDPRHKRFIELWCKFHVDVFGDRYVFMGGKDGAMLKRLLKATDICVEDLVICARNAWRNKKAFHCRNSTSIAYFCSNFNAIKRELESQDQPASTAERIEARKKLEAEQKRIEDAIEDIERFTRNPVYRTNERMTALEKLQSELGAVKAKLAAL